MSAVFSDDFDLVLLDNCPVFRYYCATNQSRSREGRQPGDSGGRSECGARGQGLVTFALGRLGHQPAGTITGVRGARCKRGRRWRGQPADFGVCPAKPGPSGASGTRLPLVRAAVERRKVYAPSNESAGRSPQDCGGYGTASYGVPLPFLFFVIARSEATKQSRAARSSAEQAALDCFASLAMTA